MEANTVSPRDFQVIQSYGDGGFRISGTRHEGSVLVFPDHTVAWPVTSAEAMTAESLAALDAPAGGTEILLLGTGARMASVPPVLRRRLREMGISLEVMDTGAACRTYNVLLAEKRQVAAALLAVG